VSAGAAVRSDVGGIGAANRTPPASRIDQAQSLGFQGPAPSLLRASLLGALLVLTLATAGGLAIVAGTFHTSLGRLG
jgi:hypothetical protein